MVKQPIYIYQTACFIQPATRERTSLKEPLKAANFPPSLRRAGRFNQLAILGAKACCEGIKLPQASSLIISSVNGPITNTGTMLASVIQQHQVPMPFNFMNSQNNSACFYVAQTLGIKGSSLVCVDPKIPLESAMMMAKVEWAGSNNHPVLVGHVDEWTLPSYLHPTGYHTAEPTALSKEGSCWFLLSNKLMAARPLATLLELSLALPADKVISTLNQYSCHLNSVAWDLDQAAKALLANMIKEGDTLSLDAASQLEAAVQLSHVLKQGDKSLYCRLHQTLAGFNLMLFKRNAA